MLLQSESLVPPTGFRVYFALMEGAEGEVQCSDALARRCGNQLNGWGDRDPVIGRGSDDKRELGVAVDGRGERLADSGDGVDKLSCVSPNRDICVASVFLLDLRGFFFTLEEKDEITRSLCENVLVQMAVIQILKVELLGAQVYFVLMAGLVELRFG